jgi:uncharacterized membrane protein
MSKQEFLAQLEKGLYGLPQADIDERLGFYSEMIDDRMEEGLSEEDAVAGIGSVDEVIAGIVADIPLSKLVKERIPKQIDAGLIVLLVLGFPVWLPILIAGFAVVFSLYVSLWAVLVALWAVAGAVAVCAPAGLVVSIIFFCLCKGFTGLAILGGGIVCAGLAILLFIGCSKSGKWAGILTKKLAHWTKKAFIKKERNNG